MDNIIDRIKKLIAHERSARSIGSTAEAESFAELIQKLLVKHKLSMTEVEIESLDKNDPIGHSTAGLNTKRTKKWDEVLASGIAGGFFCKVLLRAGGEQNCAFIFIGRESDRNAAKEMFQYLASLAPKFAKAFTDRIMPNVKQIVEQELEAQGRSYAEARKALRQATTMARRDFLLGFVVAICKRLESSRQYLESDATRSAKGIILRDRLVIEGYAEQQFKLGADHIIAAPKLGIPAAGAAGYRAGMAVGMSARPALGSGT